MRNKKNMSVSVGISAHNEEKTIEGVIKDILTQEERGWLLKEIIVYCDGCTDKTAEIAKGIKSKLVKVYQGTKRKGKTFRVNQIFSDFTGDILVMFDADVKLANRDVITKMVAPFTKDKEVMLVGGNSKVFPPKTFFERAIYTSYLTYYEAREKMKDGHNIYGCTGACLALKRDFAKKVSIPDVVTEDAYLYFSCISLGYKFRYAKNARVFYHLAGNLKDFVKQIFRTHPEAMNAVYKKDFGKLIRKEYQRPIPFYLSSVLKAFVNNPVGAVYMALIKLACKPFFSMISPGYKIAWFTAKSTKRPREGRKKTIIISCYDDLKNPYYAGGGAYAVHEVAKRFTLKDKVTVITGCYPGSRNEIIEKVAYKRIGIGFGGPKFGQLVYHLALPFYAATQKYDLWIESFTPPFSTSFLQVFTKKPVIGLVHMLSSGDMRRKYKLPFHLIESLGLKTYRRFIVLTEKTKEKILEINRTANVKIIPNGVNIPPRKRDFKRNYLLFIGRIEVNQKGLDLLLKALKRIHSQEKMKLLIAGSGTEREEMQLHKLVAKLDLEESVEYIGRVSGEKKAEVFAKARLVIIPSRFETFPLTSLEALSYRTPIVAFDIEGLSWLPENCAFKVKAFDEKQLAAAILKLIKNKKLRKKMGKEGEKLVSNYTWDNVYREYYRFVAQTLALNSKRLSI